MRSQIAAFDLNELESVISIIKSGKNLFLEVVNHNIKRQQYVCTGSVSFMVISQKHFH